MKMIENQSENDAYFLEEYECMLSQLEMDLMHILEKNGPQTRKDLIKVLNKPRTTIYDNLVKLMNKQIVKKYARPRNTIGRPLVFFTLCE
jgi:predicted transcriptional regulator